MLANKDAEAFLALLAPVARSVTAVPIDGHDCHPPEHLAGIAARLGLPARTAADLAEAMDRVDGPALITGSLYLAGVALALNGEAPD
jgi:dihydrofolate synthase / folylpolyglutamate synthase